MISPVLLILLCIFIYQVHNFEFVNYQHMIIFFINRTLKFQNLFIVISFISEQKINIIKDDLRDFIFIFLLLFF